ncbi:hypothetical protein [Mycoplana sp. MJR14]|uniref:hypothetical protein n=1 Tax=Mycoplana sp. MJR14 TaxID=3032583 RepID=UPI0023DB2EB9|nr:hypothetical protein [Mycoplana sp. MJR14]MDF1631689.1 hypothetical protein [Mycoplana sp. MJR14]
MRYRAGIISLLFLLTGCGTGPSTKDVAAFGAATANAVSVIGETASLEQDLAVAYATEVNACRYLQGRPYVVGSLRIVPPVPRLAEQKKFLAALTRYATALSKATDPAAVAELEAAAGKLTESASSLIAAATPANAVAAPVVKAAVKGLVFLSEQQRMQKIRTIIADTDPWLFDAMFILLENDENDRDLLDRRLREWEGAARCTMRQVQPARAGAYQQFMASDKAKREYLERERAANRRVLAVGTLAETHRQLARGQIDLAAATAQINSLLDIVGSLEAIRTEEETQ